jgi:predicted Zn-dependent peptidase
MPDFTHYDYASTGDNLEKILEIEAARMSQTSFDPAMISIEAKRVYSETDFVENNPAAGMLKHAFMALAHAWRYQSRSASVRGGLDEMDAGKLFDFYKASYVPHNLTIAITGKATEEQVKSLAEKHLGNLPHGNQVIKPIDWATVPASQTVRWDSKYRAVCVAWNPPATRQEQVLVSLLGAITAQKLMTDQSLLEKTEMIMCSNQMWMVGDLPLFVYAMAKPDQDLGEIETLLKGAFAREILSASQNAQMMRSFAFQFDFQRKPTAWARMQQSSKALQNMGRNESSSLQMVLAQDALQRCILRRLLGSNADEMLSRIKLTGDDELVELVNKTVTDERCHVVQIVPLKK